MNFQGTDNAVCGVDQQATLLDILKGKEKVYTKKMEKERTVNEERIIQISRELDKEYRI